MDCWLYVLNVLLLRDRHPLLKQRWEKLFACINANWDDIQCAWSMFGDGSSLTACEQLPVNGILVFDWTLDTCAFKTVICMRVAVVIVVIEFTHFLLQIIDGITKQHNTIVQGFGGLDSQRRILPPEQATPVLVSNVPVNELASAIAACSVAAENGSVSIDLEKLREMVSAGPI